MKKLTAILFCILLLSSCVSTEPDFSGSVISCTDNSGYTVTVPKSPAKVAVLFSSFADIWTAAGVEIAITVGETVEREIVQGNVILVDGGAGKSIDCEALIAARPDLVICSADIPAQLNAAMLCKDAGIPALALRVESFEDYLSVLELFTRITGNEERYDTYGKQPSNEITELKRFSSDDSILFIRAGSTKSSTKAKSANEHFAAAMLKELGTRNVAENAPVLLDGISFEEILRENPDRIFISLMGDEDSAMANVESMLKTPEWSLLSAVQNGNVYVLPKELFQYKPNARWAQAYRYLTECLSEGE